MKKKICLLVFMSVSTMLLSACSSTKTLEEENNAIVAQYIAGSILKYDKYYQDGLVYAYQRTSEDENATVEIEQTVQVGVKEDTKKDTDVDETTKLDNSNEEEEVKETLYELSDIYQLKDIAVDYLKYTTTSSYTGSYSDQAFGVEAKSGNELVVFEFKIKNNSKKKQNVKLIRSGISYNLKIGEEVHYPILSIVSNDIQYFESTIAAGKAKKAVLIFEVPKKTKVKDSTLIVTNADKASQITVK
ncbi:DUF5067 domain-containing protein [Anaerosporobacter sp.]